jgi:homoserine kinase
MYRIVSRATTANLGAGFDCLGMCFELSNTFMFRFAKEGITVNSVDDAEKNTDNLAVKSFMETCDIIGVRQPSGLCLNIATYVPLSRGLGSSATCISAGVAAAFMYAGARLDMDRIYNISAMMEGHPDNVSANIFGNGALSYSGKDGEFKHVSFRIHDKFKFCALIPPFKIQTSEARDSLPGTYTREDAVFNIGRAALCMSALQSGNSLALADALDDRMHPQYRAHLIESYHSVVEAAMSTGAIGTFLSGSGPTIIAVYQRFVPTRKIESALRARSLGWEAMPLAVSRKGLECFAE